jgi:hypothetical protein
MRVSVCVTLPRQTFPLRTDSSATDTGVVNGFVTDTSSNDSTSTAQVSCKVGGTICSEALMIIGIHEYIAIFMNFGKIMGISRVS